MHSVCVCVVWISLLLKLMMLNAVVFAVVVDVLFLSVEVVAVAHLNNSKLVSVDNSFVISCNWRELCR